MELWKEIKNHPLYEVSNFGNVRRKGALKNRCLGYDKDGYSQIQLFEDRKAHTLKVHRLVALAFIQNPNNYPQVNHIDENKKNNHVDNLEWCTCKQNMNHSSKRIYHDSITHRMKKVLQYKLDGTFIREWESVRSAARFINATNSHITDCCNGKYSTCKGYKWKWANTDDPVELKGE